MKISNVRPLAASGGGRFRDVALFDAEVADGLRLLDMKLARAPDGKNFVFSPRLGGQRHIQFTGTFARRLGDAACTALEGGDAHVRH